MTEPTTGTEIIRVVHGQIVHGQELQLFVDAIKKQAASIVIKDRDSCGEADEIVKKCDDAVAAIILAAEPERVRLQQAKEKLLGDRDKICAMVTTISDSLRRDSRAFKIAEKEATEKEQERINRNKKPDQRVTVAPDLPKTPGTRFVPRFRFEVTDAKKVKKQFWHVDEDAIGKKVREDRDKAKSEKEIGGIRVWIE